MHPPYLHGGRYKTSEATLEEVESSHARGGKGEVLKLLQNEKGEEVSTRPTSGWKVCIDYRRLNAVTRKDHFHCFSWIKSLRESQDILSTEDPFGLCNALQLSKMYAKHLSDMVERIRKSSWMTSLAILMVQQGIVLGHIISKNGIEDAKFVWDEKSQKSFEELKQFLTTAPIVRAPNWKLPYEVMCDASDLAMGAVLGQREDGSLCDLLCSKTLNEAQRNYTTTKKVLLIVVFALDKFRAYLVGSSIVVFTDIPL
ncbi:Retrovirus-related Pol polyprotein from transposon opus [Vitis vinifera]|uniref:Retrovirus-related Pol polyprotein from transposon opus n=1 Tax=Vitis vinifera TaxID=29760 RepID=A0A438FSK1_VITVI|nr:Retrovirus-related Pol polyprotein from transposon opus [Vitis vinifera]